MLSLRTGWWQTAPAGRRGAVQGQYSRGLAQGHRLRVQQRGAAGDAALQDDGTPASCSFLVAPRAVACSFCWWKGVLTSWHARWCRNAATSVRYIRRTVATTWSSIAFQPLCVSQPHQGLTRLLCAYRGHQPSWRRKCSTVPSVLPRTCGPWACWPTRASPTGVLPEPCFLTRWPCLSLMQLPQPCS